MKPFYVRQAQTWAMFTALLMLAVSMSACSTLGYEGVDTTRKSIVVAVAEVRAQNLLLQDLVRRQAISQSDSRQALGHLQSAKNTLQQALTAIDVAGDPVTALSKLESANITLTIAINILAPLVEDG